MTSGHVQHSFTSGVRATADRSTLQGESEDDIAAALADHLHYEQAIPVALASRHDWYMALALTVRDRLLDRYLTTINAVLESRAKVVAYLSAEFLTGPHLGNNLLNLGIWDHAAGALARFGQNLDDLLKRRKSQGSATADSADSPHATWTRSPPSAFRRLATASATNSASSIRPFVTAVRWR